MGVREDCGYIIVWIVAPEMTVFVYPCPEIFYLMHCDFAVSGNISCFVFQKVEFTCFF